MISSKDKNIGRELMSKRLLELNFYAKGDRN